MACVNTKLPSFVSSDTQIAPEILRTLVENSNKPLVIAGQLKTWLEARSWKARDVCDDLATTPPTTFKVFPRKRSSLYKAFTDGRKGALFETDCISVEASFADFREWLVEDSTTSPSPTECTCPDDSLVSQDTPPEVTSGNLGLSLSPGRSRKDLHSDECPSAVKRPKLDEVLTLERVPKDVSATAKSDTSVPGSSTVKSDTSVPGSATAKSDTSVPGSATVKSDTSVPGSATAKSDTSVPGIEVSESMVVDEAILMGPETHDGVGDDGTTGNDGNIGGTADDSNIGGAGGDGNIGGAADDSNIGGAGGDGNIGGAADDSNIGGAGGDGDIGDGNIGDGDIGGDNGAGSNPLLEYPGDQFWVYADYKYMCNVCKDTPKLLDPVDWGVFGYEGRGGRDSVLWVGSEGACTPCHYDTYGYNMVAQLSGCKRWTLFSPDDSRHMYPTRLPYEELSVFSQVDLDCPDFEEFPKFRMATPYQVVLQPGEVLLVPKHWWHYVETVGAEPSVSINTWMPVESDSLDKVQEALVRTLVSAFIEDDSAELINPNEELFSNEVNLRFLSQAVKKHKDSQSLQHEQQQEHVSGPQDALGDILRALTHETVLQALMEVLLTDSK